MKIILLELLSYRRLQERILSHLLFVQVTGDHPIIIDFLETSFNDLTFNQVIISLKETGCGRQNFYFHI